MKKAIQLSYPAQIFSLTIPLSFRLHSLSNDRHNTKAGINSFESTPASKLHYPMAFTSLNFWINTNIQFYFFLFRTFTFFLLYGCTVTSVSFSSVIRYFFFCTKYEIEIRFPQYLTLLYFKSLTLPHFCYLNQITHLTFLVVRTFLSLRLSM